MNKEIRNESFDIAKGIGMLAVIVAHMSVSKLLYNSLYTFHLPLFSLDTSFIMMKDSHSSYERK